MFKGLSSTVKWAIIAGIILFVALLAFLLWYSARQAGKRKGTVVINTSNPGTDSNTAAASSEAEVRTLAEKLYKDMRGISGYHSADPWNDLLAMSDTDFIRVYNEFDTEYQKDSGETLVQWVNDQWAVPLTQWATIKDTLLQRFSKLNLI